MSNAKRLNSFTLFNPFRELWHEDRFTIFIHANGNS